MSGIYGIFNFDGSSASPRLLQQMAEYMTFRGPDKQNTWIDGQAGLGHTLLCSTDESLHELQPFSLDNEVWIAADARIDGRDDLVSRLKEVDNDHLKNATDVELILRAYHAWGENCVNYLIGDFTFAIWEKRRQILFCARDHFGIKPFYYALKGNCLIISNTLNCIRLHPNVSDRLNDQAVGDFLILGINGNHETTFFADVQSLPAAHTLTWSKGDLRTRRYWTMPIGDEIHYRRESDYVEHFVELFDKAVNDRMRTDRVGVFMSGGMDSTTIATTAKKLLSSKRATFDLQAYTVVYDRLISDEERRYSGLVAKYLRIPINYIVADDYYKPIDRFDEPELSLPEPGARLGAMGLDQFRQIKRHTRVMLTGHGGDVVLRGSFSYIINLFKRLRFDRMVMEVGRHVLRHRSLPQIGFRTRIRRYLGTTPGIPLFPDWVNSDFEARLNLRERWHQLLAEDPHRHPRRPEAYKFLTNPMWTRTFEAHDPERTNFPIETRHPFFDLRLLRYLMAMPTLPVCVDKRLLRLAMKELLPEETLRRPKATYLRQDANKRVWNFVPAMGLSQYVDINKCAKRDAYIETGYHQQLDSGLVTSEIRPIMLNHWLKSLGKPICM